MYRRFNPGAHPDRVIVVDETTRPLSGKINCVRCGRLTPEVWKDGELCKGCYRDWSLDFAKRRLRRGSASLFV